MSEGKENTVKTWVCEKCGTENTGNFCGECGTKKGEIKEVEETVKEVIEEVKEPEQVELKDVVEPMKEETKEVIASPEVKKSSSSNSWVVKVLACIGLCALVFAGGYAGGTIATNRNVERLEREVDALEKEMVILQEKVESLESDSGFLDGFLDIFGGQNQAPENNENNEMPFGHGQQSTVTGAGLGVSIREVGDDAVIVAFSETSKAEDAGLAVGDIIKEIDGEDADSYDEIRSILEKKNAGDKILITVERDGEEVSVEVELIELG